MSPFSSWPRPLSSRSSFSPVRDARAAATSAASAAGGVKSDPQTITKASLRPRVPSPSCGSVATTNRRNFGCQVDADRALGDAASAAHAPGGAELVDPGCQLVDQPLPILRAGRRPNTSTVDVRVLQRETRIPPSPSLRRLTSEVCHILYGGTEAGRTDQRAVRTAQASTCHIVPLRVVEVPVQGILHSASLELAPHPCSSPVDRRVRFPAIALGGPLRG